MKLTRILMASVLLTLGTAAIAADWPRFRGPNGVGVSDETGLPVEWSDASNIAWKRDLLGAGGSSPVTVGDRLFVTCYSGYGLDAAKPGDMQALKLHLVCLRRSNGEPLWQKDIDPKLPEQQYSGFLALHGYASSTPCTDGERIVAFFGAAGVFCFDLDGNELWHKSVGDRTDKWGSATSPVIHENAVIVDASVESGSLVGLNKETGDEVWRASEIRRAWNSPIVAKSAEGRAEAIISSQGQLKAFDPLTGEQLWTCAGIEDYVCPSVIAHDGIVYALGGRSKNGVAVRMGGSGNVSETHLLYRIPGFTNVSSPVFHEGKLYWMSESQGFAYCADAATGAIVYRELVEPASDRVYASAVLADGKVYYVSRTEGVYVVAARPEFTLLAHNKFSEDESIFNASPAVSNGQLLLRSDRRLYCIGAR